MSGAMTSAMAVARARISPGPASPNRVSACRSPMRSSSVISRSSAGGPKRSHQRRGRPPPAPARRGPRAGFHGQARTRAGRRAYRDSRRSGLGVHDDSADGPSGPLDKDHAATAAWAGFGGTQRVLVGEHTCLEFGDGEGVSFAAGDVAGGEPFAFPAAGLTGAIWPSGLAALDCLSRGDYPPAAPGATHVVHKAITRR